MLRRDFDTSAARHGVAAYIDKLFTVFSGGRGVKNGELGITY